MFQPDFAQHPGFPFAFGAARRGPPHGPPHGPPGGPPFGRGPHGPFGGGPPWGRPMGGGGPFGPWGPARRLRRGLIRRAVLAALGERAVHGYDLIRRLADKSGGRWQPSAGSIYPTLQQ